jgi:hypothetical protein
LAADLEFLVPDLLLAGCEIYLMQTSSLAHNPGALWRYLAFEEKEKWVTVVDADRAPHMLQDIERTEGTAKVGLGWWRVPVWGELNRYGKMNYRPFLGCQLGACTWLPMNLLMQAMIWHSKRGSMPHTATPPGCAAAEIAGHDWPNYGYDEWFLSAAVYPRAAMDGILTFVPSDAKCRILALDVAYCLQMNQQSEMAYFGSNGTGCCGSAGTSNKAPGLVRPREDSTVVLRNRSGKKTAPALFEFTKVLRTKGGVKAALAATEHIDTIWWVDVADDLVPGPTGAELFLDQRFAQCDLGVTGWQFVVVTAEIAKWAKRQGCAGPKWGAGAALRVPKLDAPLTLWRSAFSSKVSEALKIVNNSDITGEVLLSAWAATGKASILEASIKSQGWTLKSTQNS